MWKIRTVPRKIDTSRDDCTDANGEKCNAGLSSIKVIDALEYDGIGLQKYVKNGIWKRGISTSLPSRISEENWLTGITQVQASEQYQRLEADHAQRSSQDDSDDVVQICLL